MGKFDKIHVNFGGDMKELSKADFLSHCVKKHNVKATEAEQLFKLATSDKELPEDDERTPKETKRMASGLEEMKKYIRIHETYLKELEEEAEKEKKAKEEHGKKMSLAAMEGYAMADASVDSVMEIFQQTVGDKFDVSRSGLTIHKGKGGKPVEVTEKDMVSLIGNLARSGDKLDEIKNSVNFALGDACNLVYKHFENPDEVIANAISVTGKAKHTVKEYLRIAQIFPQEERIPEFSFTHHQEIANYREAILKKKNGKEKLDEIIEKARNGEVIADIETPDKKRKQTRKVVSVKALRDMLAEAAGTQLAQDNKDKAEEKANGKEKAKADPSATAGTGKGEDYVNDEIKGFLYIHEESGRISHNRTFVKGAAKSHIVVDMDKLFVLDSDGDKDYDIDELDADAFAEKEKKEEKPAKKKGGSKIPD